MSESDENVCPYAFEEQKKSFMLIGSQVSKNESRQVKEKMATELPGVFLERMRTILGEEYDAFIQSFREERVQGLRFNTLKASLENEQANCQDLFRLRQVPWCREGFYYEESTRPGKHSYHEAGVYYIQEPSAMAVISLLDPQPGERILDLCAAPGGKTTHAAERMKGEGLLISNEIHPGRAKILSQNVERMGITNAVVTNEDSASLRRFFPDFFDKIIVDAPCSGEGMFRKDEQARAEWSEENIRICAARQQEILDHAAAMLRPGGRLVYSTCTFAPEEDEESVAAFLSRHEDYRIVEMREDELPEGFAGNNLNSFCVEKAENDREGNDMRKAIFRIWPHKTEGEGHFLALLERKPDCRGSEEKIRKKKPAKPSFWRDRAGLRTVKTTLNEILRETAMFSEDIYDHLIVFGDQVYAVPEDCPALDGLRVLRPGLHLGTLKKNRLEPSHALALAIQPEMAVYSLCLPSDSQEIMSYLKGQTLPVDFRYQGWTLVCADRYSVGWGKASAGILKNHYPKGLRIV
ncbi:MAG: RsmB/NOP family class I SAM-dependent RNA methyltransferase [Clostridiales bacterium]|nr:RsmB/NOP family class I SAM-dependent RNA methyltransferase [Clostridiales bacterium]